MGFTDELKRNREKVSKMAMLRMGEPSKSFIKEDGSGFLDERARKRKVKLDKK